MERRKFLKKTAMVAGTAVAARGLLPAWVRAEGANSDVRVGVIGFNAKGANHLKQLQTIRGARIVALCDVDPRVLAREVEILKDKHIPVFATTEARKLLERSDVNAVVIASPNHWHALHTLWACEAGKDVYVEKPVSHTVWEGQKMVEAASRYNRVVQAGTQKRSDTGMPEVIAYLREGHLGKIQWIHSVCYKLREPMPRRLPWYPDWLDYNTFCGPAAVNPLTRDSLHYDWHWYWSTGNGDLANIGIHEFDAARWVAGDPSWPARIMSIGGHFVSEDTGETPNTQLTVFDFPGLPIILENRGLPVRPGFKEMDHVHGVRQGIYVQCEGGYFAGRYGGSLYDRNGKRLKSIAGDGGATHLPNFIEVVRTRRKENLAAPIETGHASTAPCLYGNVSYRLGSTGGIIEAREKLAQIPPARQLLDRMLTHLGTHGLTHPQLTIGPWLSLQHTNGDILAVSERGEDAIAYARHLVRGTHRPPYTLPVLSSVS